MAAPKSRGTPRAAPTMADVARVAEVSKMTVSYAYTAPARVASATLSRVLAAAEGLGYPGPHPAARSLRLGRAGALGVVLGEPLTYAFDDPQAAQFLAGIASVCAREELGVTLIPVLGRDSDRARIAEANVDGFVLWTTSTDDPTLDAVAATGRPAVILGGPGHDGIDVVTIDDRAAGRAIAAETFERARHPAVVSHPLSLARERDVLVNVDPATVRFSVAHHRLHGIRDYIAGTAHPWERVPIATTARNLEAEGRAAAERLLDAETAPDAIVAMSDELAFGVMGAVLDRGLRIPEDVRVSGWDDSSRSAALGLTTVHQSLRAQGSMCAQILLEPDSPREPIEWSIVRRATTRHD